MTCVIQNISTGKFLKHNGKYDPEQYCYDDVEKQEDAEQFSGLQHAFYAATWHADMFEKWRVINEDTGTTYVQDENGKFVKEARE